MQKQKKQLSTFVVMFITLMLILACLIAILGCEEQIKESNPDNSTDNSTNNSTNNSTAPSKVAIDIDYVSTNAISISWLEPADTGKRADGKKAAFTGYKIYYKEGDTVTLIDENLLNATRNSGLQAATKASITGLTPYTDYAIVVVATNLTGKHSVSEVKEQKTISAATSPAKISVNPVNDTTEVIFHSLAISWNAPTDIGKDHYGTSTATITGYKIYYKAGTRVSTNDGILLNAATNEGVQTDTSITISELQPGTQYAIIIVAFNSVGKSSTSEVQVRKTGSLATAPGKAIINSIGPANVNNNSIAISVSWDIPTTTGKEHYGKIDATITGYKIYYRIGTTVSTSNGALLNSGTNGGLYTGINNLTFSGGLHSGHQYAVIVVSVNSAGLSSSSIPRVTRVAGHPTTTKYIKLNNQGEALINQHVPYSSTGTEKDGSKWSCVKFKYLVWEVKLTDGGLRDHKKKYQWGGAETRKEGDIERKHYGDWDELVNAANNEALCGYTDWRIPSRSEQLWIMEQTKDLGDDILHINTNYFPNTQAYYYWSSTPQSGDIGIDRAWYINYFLGRRSDHPGLTYLSMYVRLVRGPDHW